MLRRVIDRLGIVTWAVFGLVICGGALVIWGATREDGYFASALLEIGAALFLAVPLLFLERLMDSRINRLQAAAEESIDNVRTEVRGVRQEVQDARTQIDELGQATAKSIADVRAADADAVQTMRDDVTEPNVWRALHRAQELGALDRRGVRVRLDHNAPEEPLCMRFAASPGHGEHRDGVLNLVVERRNGDRVTDPEEWTSDEPADKALTRLAGALQRVNAYPGDSSFDAGAIFERLASTLELVLSLRTGARSGARLGPVVELVGDWAVTTDGLEHASDEQRAVRKTLLLSAPSEARETLLRNAADPEADETFSEAFATAVDYHQGQDRRAARERLERQP